MMQPSDGSQTDSQKPSPGKAFLSDFISQAIEKLRGGRIPSSFQQMANGQVSQDLIANKENYV
jgi:hypothetical protein